MLLIQPKQRATEAEQCLKEAIALAQQQEAKFWELRATPRSPNFGPIKGDPLKLTTFWHPSTAASPKVSTRST